MSTINLHPPQTYSRLFRPWDTHRNTPAAVRCASENTDALPMVKREPSHASTSATSSSTASTTTTTIKTELPASSSYNHAHHSQDNERECASISSSSSSSSSSVSSSCSSSKSCSYEDGLHSLNGSYTRTSTPKTLEEQQPLPLPGSPLYAGAAANAATVGTPQSLSPQQATPFMPAASDLYYAAAAAAAAASSPNAAAAAAAAFGMDPFTLGLMEQEYARVMAEDAQLKAMNARKQRPKKFKCPHCDVAFSNNGQLKGHIRIHTGERPFKCDVETCGKTFTRNEELTRHKRIHTGLRPYPCSACGKKFGRRDHLKKHMKTHMPQERQLGPAFFVPMYPYLYGY